MELLFPLPVWIVTLALCLLHAYRSRRTDHVAAVVKAFALSVLWTAAAVAAFWGLMFLVDFVADIQIERALFIVIAGWAILYVAVALASFGYNSFLVYAATAACCGWFGWSYRASPWGMSWFAAILGSVTILAAFAGACSAFLWARWEVFGWRPSEEAWKRTREESKRRRPDASDEDIERYLADGEAETLQTLKEAAQFGGTVALWAAIATFFVGSAAVYPQAYEHVFASYVSRLTAHKSSQADGLAIRTCLAQRWDYDAQMECERAARNRNPDVASTEISRMVEDAAAENQEAALADNKRDRDFPALTDADVKAAIHRTSEENRINAVRKCMQEHNWALAAQTQCDK
jgi:hypothetical protein